jgi:hypothetical protein
MHQTAWTSIVPDAVMISMKKLGRSLRSKAHTNHIALQKVMAWHTPADVNSLTWTLEAQAAKELGCILQRAVIHDVPASLATLETRQQQHMVMAAETYPSTSRMSSSNLSNHGTCQQVAAVVVKV